ncbi:RING finger protein 141 isoform X1 [Microtus pennsylvanicus]|uniref:RING finger protein 141 isoform X1 n=1 Tax=Microtus pennsylvanicus TaxID=10058 RepID=UPI003F6C51A4
MGQQISDQTQLVINKLPEKVAKHVTLVRESGSLTYEEFLGRVAELNDVTAKVAAGQEKHLLFEVQPGSDSSAFWKVVVRVVCTKINKSSGIVEASRIMNLYQFIQLYKDITSQAAGVLAQSSASEEPDGSLSSVTSCQASLWMGRPWQSTQERTNSCVPVDAVLVWSLPPGAPLLRPHVLLFCLSFPSSMLSVLQASTCKCLLEKTSVFPGMLISLLGTGDVLLNVKNVFDRSSSLFLY